MSDTCPVVRVANESAPGGFVEVNATDFDAKTQELYVEPDARALADMTVPELKALAEARKVDLGDATKKADIVAALELAAEAAADDEQAAA